MKGDKTIIGIVAGLIMVLLVISGCSTPTGKIAQEKKQPIKIGFLEPLTGEISSIGQNNRKGVELAVKEINDAGGINGRPIEVIYEDGKCNAKDAATAAQKLVNIDQVVAIVGGLCSSETIAAAPIAEGKTVMLSPGSSNPSITGIGDYIFRNYPSDVFQGKYAAEFAYNELEVRKAAIIYCLSDWCLGLDKKFKEEFTKLGGEIVSEQGYEQTSKDLRTQLIKIKNSKPEFIYFLGYTDASVIGLQQAKELGITVPILGGDAWADATIAQKAGKAADGVLHTEVNTPITEEFKAKMKTFTGSDEVTLATPQAYDALRIIAGVISKVGDNPADIKDAMYRVKYEGIAGEVSFDSNGDLTTATYAVKEYQDGKIIDYQR